METTESDIGYPEEQPSEIDDTPAEGTPQREQSKPRKRDQHDHDEGPVTGNPKVD